MAACSAVHDHYSLPDPPGAQACRIEASATCSECPARLCDHHMHPCSVCKATLCQAHGHRWVTGCGETLQVGYWCTAHELADRMRA